MKDKLKGLLGTLAPMVGTALGGPFGGIATKAILSALDVDSEQAALNVIESDPDALAKLRIAEQNFKQTMRELDIKEEDLHQKDRADARAMGIATTLKPQITLSVVFIAGYFGVIATLIAGLWAPPEGTEQLVAALIGVLTAGVVKILDFWFGSSAGSKQKTLALANGK